MSTPVKSLWQLESWPFFRWDDASLAPLISVVRFRQGRLLGRMESLDEDARRAARERVRETEITASLELAGVDPGKSSGLARALSDATDGFENPLTVDRVLRWHRALAAHDGGSFRSVESADDLLPASRIPAEMRQLVKWFERRTSNEPLVKAALVHLALMIIQPFDTGNGRIAGILTDMQLARSEHSPERYYSLSHAIVRNRDDYMATLSSTRRGTLDVTEWIARFVELVRSAINHSADLLSGDLRRDAFWRDVAREALNERQIGILEHMLSDEYTGPMKSSTWAKMTGVSRDTAVRDIQELLDDGVFVRNPGGGRSTSYRLAIDDASE